MATNRRVASQRNRGIPQHSIEYLGTLTESKGIDGCPTFAPAYSGFPVELSGVVELHAAFLNESRTRGCWWGPVQEIRIRGTKMMGAAHRTLFTLSTDNRTYP